MTPSILKGIGKKNGDGWKDVTKVGEVVFVWNTEMPAPYKKGQYPRIGNQCGWTASTDQYDFVAATPEEARDAIETMLSTAAAARTIESDAQGAKLSVGVLADRDHTTVAVQLHRGDHTTVLYGQRHPANQETMGAVSLPAGLFSDEKLS